MARKSIFLLPWSAPHPYTPYPDAEASFQSTELGVGYKGEEVSPQLPHSHPHSGHSPPPSPQTRARRSRHTWGVRVGGSERRRGREWPRGRGEDCGPRPGDANEPRGLADGGAERESAKEGASREDQLLGAQITAPPTPPPKPCRSHPERG